MGEWKKVKLGDCLKEVVEKTTENNQYEVLTSSKDGIFSQEEYFDKQVASKNNVGYKIIKKGQFTYRSMSDSGRFTINKLDNKDIGIVSPAYPVFEAEKVNPDYLKYFFDSEMFRRAIHNLSQGSTRTALKFKDLIEIEMLIPPIEEQEKILKILNNVDNTIEYLEQLIENIEIEKKGIIDKQLNTKDYFKKTFNQLIEENVIEDIMDGNHGELHPKTTDYVSNGIPFIMANNVHDGELDLTNCSFLKKDQADKLRKGFAKEGDVLLTHKGTIGNVAFVPDSIDTEYIMLTPQVTYYRIKKNNDILTKEYLYYFLQSSEFQNKLKLLSMQSTRAYIGITEQKKLKIKIPSLTIQTKICNILQSMDKKNKLLKSKKKNYIKLKKALMQQLLTGNIKVKI